MHRHGHDEHHCGDLFCHFKQPDSGVFAKYDSANGHGLPSARRRDLEYRRHRPGVGYYANVGGKFGHFSPNHRHLLLRLWANGRSAQGYADKTGGWAGFNRSAQKSRIDLQANSSVNTPPPIV